MVPSWIARHRLASPATTRRCTATAWCQGHGWWISHSVRAATVLPGSGGHQRLRRIAGRRPFSSGSWDDAEGRLGLWSRRSEGRSLPPAAASLRALGHEAVVTEDRPYRLAKLEPSPPCGGIVVRVGRATHVPQATVTSGIWRIVTVTPGGPLPWAVATDLHRCHSDKGHGMQGVIAGSMAFRRLACDGLFGAGRSDLDAWVGCIVSSTTANSSTVRCSRSTCWCSRSPHRSIVWTASSRRRLNRRSTAAWSRRRTGWNSAHTARVAAATIRLESRPSSWPRPRTTAA